MFVCVCVYIFYQFFAKSEMLGQLVEREERDPYVGYGIWYLLVPTVALIITG
jgi:hypothetical protein